MEVNSTLRKITEYIEEKILVAVIELEFVCQTSTIVFVQKCTYAIFSLIDSRQIVTDTCKKRCFKFVWKPTKSPLSATEIKFFSVKPLSLISITPLLLPFTYSKIVLFK